MNFEKILGPLNHYVIPPLKLDKNIIGVVVGTRQTHVATMQHCVSISMIDPCMAPRRSRSTMVRTTTEMGDLANMTGSRLDWILVGPYNLSNLIGYDSQETNSHVKILKS